MSATSCNAAEHEPQADTALQRRRLGSGWHAAKLLEQAAAVATQSGDVSSLQDLYTRAGQLYVECGRATTAAETFLKCAKAIETTNAQVRSGLCLCWLQR